MKKKWIYLLAAMVFAVGVCASQPVVSGAAPVDMDRTCSLQVFPENPDKPEEDKFGEDLASADVVIDLYYIADAIKAPGYDTYAFQTVGRYQSLELSDTPSAEDWEHLSQQAAELALGEDDTDTPIKSAVKVGSESISLDAGLYLMIARGAALTSVADYKVEVTQSNEETEEAVTRLATIANSAKYQYTFIPQLISLPTKGADEDGEVNTGNPGEWYYDLTVNLKPERTARYGALEIVKTLSEYESEEGIESPVTCVFEVTGILNGEEVYSEVESITFTKAGQERVVLNQIPALAEVTVREVYSGAGYELTVPGDRTATIAANEIVSVDFENVYNGQRRGGHGIKNQFVQDENGVWHWHSDPAQDTAGNEGTPPSHLPVEAAEE